MERLLRELEVHPNDVVVVPGLLDLSCLWQLHNVDRKNLKDPPFVPATHPAFAEPDNDAVADRLEAVSALREEGKITLPTTVAEELATNPFVRARDAEDFARLRADKDSFRS